jgi:hypothetical protein
MSILWSLTSVIEVLPMKQSDGSEILGPDDPRNLVIGIIHVSPSDERQSVVNAITAQDQMGRDQIVLVLPSQNNSFKNAVDFTGLRQMASELEGSLVLVAPARSKIASFARKEGFTVYPTLEDLTSAEFPPLAPDGEPEPGNAPAASGASAAPDADDAMAGTMAFPVEQPHTPPPAQTASASASPMQTTPEDKIPTSPLSRGSAQTLQAAPVATPPAQPASPASPVPPTPVAVPPSPSAPEEEDDTDPVLTAPLAADQQTGTPSSNLPAVVPASSGSLVPSDPQLPVYYPPLEPQRQRSWKGWLIAAVTIVVLLGLGILFYRPLLDLFFPPTATVTIVPVSQQLKHTYQITAVLGVPVPGKDQVDARALYADSQMQEQTTRATGKGQIAGQQAHGALTFVNITATTQTIPEGTIIFDTNGLAFVNEQTVTLPAFAGSSSDGVTVPAHSVNVGAAQNIAAYDFDYWPCCNNAVDVVNTQPFTGGQDQRTFTYVQQSDIDGVVQSVSAAQTQQATMALQGQIRPNEKPAGAPRCSPQVESDHQAGEQADSVTVRVTTSCVGEVYDLQAVQALAAHKLSQDAASNPGPGYIQVGTILVQVTQATPDPHGNVVLVTNAGGVWAYQFTASQRAHLARLIAGQNKQDAHTRLLQQTGVQSATITLTGVSVTTIPNDLKRITINVEAVQGAMA